MDNSKYYKRNEKLMKKAKDRRREKVGEEESDISFNYI